jgi:hypothetical protein
LYCNMVRLLLHFWITKPRIGSYLFKGHRLPWAVVFRGFSLQANAAIKTLIQPRPCPFAFFPIHYSLIPLPCDATFFLHLKPSLNHPRINKFSSSHPAFLRQGLTF